MNTRITTSRPALIYASERKLSGHKSPEFSHDRHQLTLVLDGAVCVENNFGWWTAPAGAAAWIAAGTRHSVEGQGAAWAQTLYISRAPSRLTSRRCAIIGVTPLLRALVDHICRREPLSADDTTSKRLAAVLLDQIDQQPELSLFVPRLGSELARRVAAALQTDPADTPRIRDLARELKVSNRTVERAFIADVAMTIGEWRQRWRMARAIALLADGNGVQQAALEVGYATPSAFVAAFKRLTGSTPGTVICRSSARRSAPSARRWRSAPARDGRDALDPRRA